MKTRQTQDQLAGDKNACYILFFNFFKYKYEIYESLQGELNKILREWKTSCYWYQRKYFSNMDKINDFIHSEIWQKSLFSKLELYDEDRIVYRFIAYTHSEKLLTYFFFGMHEYK